MKIDSNRIPPEGIDLQENIAPAELDLETESVKFKGSIKIKAHVYKITNSVTAELTISGRLQLNCSRCLSEFELGLERGLRLSYMVDKASPFIDLGPEIREDIFLSYPMKPLCKAECKGLCFKCGKNLNEGGCSCAIT